MVRQSKKRGGNPPPQNLIITTGDASDFDGFMALPLYYKAACKHNCDVAFIMNFPAYYNENANYVQDMGNEINMIGRKANGLGIQL